MAHGAEQGLGVWRAGAAPSLSLVILAVSHEVLRLVSASSTGCQDEARLALLHRNARGWLRSIAPAGWMAPAGGELD